MRANIYERILEINRDSGPLYLAGKVLSFPLDLLSIAYYSLTLRRKAGELDAKGLVRLIYEGCRGMLKPLQVRSEITELAGLVAERKPGAVLEIGTASGGTLFLFNRLSGEDADIVSVDLPMGRYGGGYFSWRAPLYRASSKPGQRLSLLRADSHSPETLERVRGLLGGRKLDVLFIDGDHTYEGAKQDFNMYSGLVRKGGLIAFHDIVEHARETGCGVDRFWSEIKEKFPHREIIENRAQRWAGIGVLFV